jgi:uncharacterized protein (DUF305 family)
MWELMNFGIEMQERMIEAHAKNLELMRKTLSAGEKQLDVGTAMNKAGKAQMELMEQWLDFWKGRH